jgi:hypothetical protein
MLVTSVAAALIGVALVRSPLFWRSAPLPASVLKALGVNPPPPPTVPTTPAVPLPPKPAALCGTELDVPAPTGKTFNVGPGGDLQSALNNAQGGDEIVLQAGATFAGSFHLPKKSGSSYITVRTSALDQLPTGTRVGPDQASKLAKLVGTNMGDAPLTTDTASHHWRLVGLEIAGTPNTYTWAAVGIGTSLETDVSQLPHDLVIDRCWIHGDAQKGTLVGVALAAANVTIANCSITDVKSIDQESSAILSYNGTGPFTILNNRLEAAGENIMFGGDDPTIQNLVPSDIVVRYNDFDKPLSWKVGDPTYAGTHWLVKNLIELKNAQRVTIDGNSFQHSWADAQAGDTAVLTVRNQDGKAPWSIVQTVAFTNNLVRHVGGGMSILGHDDNQTAQAAHDFTVSNNLFYDVGGTTWGGSGRFVTVVAGTTDPGPSNVTIDHNTAMQSGDPLVSDTPGRVVVHPGMTFTNNLTSNGQSGIWGDLQPQGDPTLSTYYPAAVLAGNALVGAPAGNYKLHPANQFPSSVQFMDAANGDYRLPATSALKHTAADGGDPGADLAQLDLAAACRK